MASRYWVGGTASWDATAGTKWALTSGGAGGQAVPTASDDVFFDANSTGTCTISGARTCLSLNCTGHVNTIAGTGTLTVSGNLTLVAGQTFSNTGRITFNATATGKTVTSGGKTIAGGVTFNGNGGGWTLQDALNCSVNSSLIVSRGSVDFNGQTVTSQGLTFTGTLTRSITTGAATLNMASTVNIGGTGYTWTATGSTINFTSSSSGGLICLSDTFPTINFPNVGSSARSISGTPTITTLNLTGAASKTGSVTFSGTCTIGTLNANGNSITNRLLLRSATRGTANTLTVNTAWTGSTNIDLEDITGAGSASRDLSGITGGAGDCGGNTNFTFSTPIDCFWVHGASASYNWSDTGRWFTTSGGASAARVPLPQDTAKFDAGSFSASGKTVVQDMARIGKVLWTGATNTPTWTTSNQTNFLSDITLISGMTLTASAQTYIYVGHGSSVLTSAGKTWAKGFDIDCGVGTLLLGDNFVSTSGGWGVYSGTFDTDVYSITAPSLASTGTGTTVINFGNQTHTFNGTGTVFRTDNTGLTLNRETSKILISNTSATAKTFNGGGKHFYQVEFSAAASNGTVTIQGSNRFENQLKFNPLGSIIFTINTTQTLDADTVWQATGTAGNLITFVSSTAATAATISCAAGTVSSDYISLKDSTATGGASFYAGANSTNVSGNTGWTFTAPPGAFKQAWARGCNSIIGVMQ